MGWVITIFSFAVSVKLAAGLRCACKIGALTNMLPSQPSPLVVTVTLVPESNKFVISELRIFELDPEVGVQVVPLKELLVVEPEETISTSYGSNSHCPPIPLIALASPVAPVVEIQCPDVSILPPSPPSEPPRANKVPCTFVMPALFCVSDQATTVPPLPF